MKDIVEELRARHARLTGGDPRITEPFVGKTMFTEAADEIERLRNELDGTQLAYRGASYDRDRMRKERDTIRRTFCLMIASGDWNIRDGSTAFRIGAEHVAELNNWDCFKEKN